MFLKDLFRYRTTDSKESREDFLSSCLAELMRRDTECCRVVLQTVGLLPPAGVASRRIRTQVRLRDGERLGIPDVVVETAGWLGIIECKAGAAPDLDQIAKYRALRPNAAVAFLAPADAIGALDPDARAKVPGTKKQIGCSDVPKASWSDVVSALVELPTDQADFRDAFVDLAGELGYLARRSPSLADASASADAAGRLEVLRPAFRAAVRALLPEKIIPEPAEPDTEDSPLVWGEGTSFNTYWETDTAPKGLPLLGLGLEVEVREGVGHDELKWALAIYPSAKATKLLRAAEGDWDETAGWWSLPLSDVGSPTDTLGDQLNAAVREARWWLRRDLKIETGTRKLTILPDAIVESLVDDVRRVERFEEAADGWMQWVWDALLTAMDCPEGGDWEARLVNGRLSVWMKSNERLWLTHELRLAEVPTLSVSANWGPQRNGRLRERLEAFAVHGALTHEFGEAGQLTVVADLRLLTLADAAAAIADTFARLFQEHRTAVLPPFADLGKY
ncbi:MAG TPA: hypothetical protein PLA94_13830 [Myxococcota bacterium]|nr:hypothetical protein [Myxococcota bacterium]